MKGKQDTDKEYLVLFLKGKRYAQDLQELDNSIVMLSLINEPIKYVVHLPRDIGPKTPKLAIDFVQDDLQKVCS